MTINRICSLSPRVSSLNQNVRVRNLRPTIWRILAYTDSCAVSFFVSIVFVAPAYPTPPPATLAVQLRRPEHSPHRHPIPSYFSLVSTGQTGFPGSQLSSSTSLHPRFLTTHSRSFAQQQQPSISSLFFNERHDGESQPPVRRGHRIHGFREGYIQRPQGHSSVPRQSGNESRKACGRHRILLQIGRRSRGC